MSYILAGIHTETGKTVCATVLAEALQYDYWKPVQAGTLDASDSIFVRQHLSNNKSKIHPEAYRLKLAASPHYAAKQDNAEIVLSNIKLPLSDNKIIVETAGGLLSPLSDNLSNLDLINYLNLPVILVSGYYLGSINHTLLTFELLKHVKAEIAGIVFCGKDVASSREIILKKTGLPLLLSIPFFENLDPKTIWDFSKQISVVLKDKLLL